MSRPEFVQLLFAGYELDEGNARLSRDGKALALTPKALAVLCVLARQPGQLVSKDALLDAVWGHRHVSESVLKTTISELRAVLGDDARSPRFIETAARRGYRFIGHNDAAPVMTEAAAPEAVASSVAPARLIGRVAALNRLRDTWQQACAGRRQMVWIAGEAGVGKTTLIEQFLSELAPQSWVKGHCVDPFGAGEPYLPALEAVSDLCRRDPGMIARLRSTAPTWLLQLPWLCSESERTSLRQELAGSSQERMVREARELFDGYSLEHPIVFVVEDLHWSDDASLRLMEHFARNQNPARVMLLCSFRLAEVVSAEHHPLKALRSEMRLHKLCQEIVLDAFSEAEVGDFIADRFPQVPFTEPFIRTLHQHTDGLPLFLVNVVEDLVLQGVLDTKTAPECAAITRLQVPESLAGVVEKQIARLHDKDRQILEAASVCGQDFYAQTVADALDRDANEVTQRCEALVRRKQWLEPLAVVRLPDGSLAARYAFRHALYRRVFYQGIGALTLAQLHRRVAASLSSKRVAGDDIGSATAAELASHFERGHEPMAALRHYADAAEHALRHFAPADALALAEHALSLAARCPESPELDDLQLTLNLRCGAAASQRYGIASSEAIAIHERTQALCNRLPDSPALGWVFNALGQASYGRAEFEATTALATRIQNLADRYDDPLLTVSACTLLGLSCSLQGQHAAARQHLERGIAVCEALGGAVFPPHFFADPGVHMGARLGSSLLMLGYVDQARTRIEKTLTRACALGNPMAIAIAATDSGVLAIALNDPETAAAHAVTLKQIADTHCTAPADANGRLIAGWVRAQQGEPEAGLEMILEGLRIRRAMGTAFGHTLFRRCAAEACIIAGRFEQAQQQIVQALELAQRIGERWYLPDLHLLQSRIEVGLGKTEIARASIHAAIGEARAQAALWMELSALVALCELENASAADRDELRGAYGRLEDGFDTTVGQRAREMLIEHLPELDDCQSAAMPLLPAAS